MLETFVRGTDASGGQVVPKPSCPAGSGPLWGYHQSGSERHCSVEERELLYKDL